MPAKWIRCPDGEIIEIEKCLSKKGCRMNERCGTVPFLRLVCFDREFRGITPSSAGNGIRYIYLKATTDYTVNPQDRVWAVLGIGTHDKLAMERYTENVLSEEELTDKQMKGIADVLEEDENEEGKYVLSDYKTWGSFKLCKGMGLTKVEREILDKEGNPILKQRGKNKGKPKTEKIPVIDPVKADLSSEEYQLNAYRIRFEKWGFPVSRMQLQVMPRDGNTQSARLRGINRNVYILPIKRLEDEAVKSYYEGKKMYLQLAFINKWYPKCTLYERWEGNRCKFCEVREKCEEMGE